VLAMVWIGADRRTIPPEGVRRAVEDVKKNY
jgi:hypothetical protein